MLNTKSKRNRVLKRIEKRVREIGYEVESFTGYSNNKPILCYKIMLCNTEKIVTIGYNPKSRYSVEEIDSWSRIIINKAFFNLRMG